MAKVIEFYARDLFPRKVKWVPPDQRGKVIEFPKDKPWRLKLIRLGNSMKPASQLSLGLDVAEPTLTP
jgi:hypothetical protein